VTARMVWLPYPPERVGALPEGLDPRVWDGVGPPPDGLDAVRFYVPPYMFGASVLEPMARMRSLEVVQTLTAGVDSVLPYLPEGVTLCNARGVHDASTAELAVGLVLASLRGIPEFVRAQDLGHWAHAERPALADRTVLLLGYGSIGAAVERRLSGFEVEVLRVASRARDGVHDPRALPDLLPRADVVVVLVPLTDQTRAMVDAGFLARMRDGALLVNVARGGVVVTDALLAELESGRLSAALDVTDPEPLPPDHPLWRAPGLLVSPHVGGNSTAFLPRAFALLRAQLARWVSGEPLANVVALR
jgi:phosphoglycerate dehydrogenase-like enzyme